MNKIQIRNNNIINNDPQVAINECPKMKVEPDSLFLYIRENTNVEVELSIDNIQYKKICFLIDTNSSLHLFECKDSKKDEDLIYNFIVNDNASLLINRFYSIGQANLNTDVHLNGVNSKVEYNCVTMAEEDQQHTINVKHNNKNTISIVNNRGVTFNKAKLELESNGYVRKGMSNSKLEHQNKIIMMQQNESIIMPNLFIDEFDVEAKHGASIGTFNEDEIFYLQTRGITISEAYQLLMQAFLLAPLSINDEEKKKIIEIINKYRR